MNGKSRFSEIAQMIVEEAEHLTAMQRSGELPLFETAGFTPFSVMAWLAQYFSVAPTLTREEQRSLDDLVKGRTRESKYVN